MPIVQHTFVDDVGIPVANEWVRITLVSRTGWWADGTRKATRVHSDQTDSNGYWERNLPPNSSYEETGTFYRVERGTDITAVEVPNGAGPYTLRSITRDPIPADAAWKVTPRLDELLGATGLATAADGQVPAWDANAKAWVPSTRTTPSVLSAALVAKADTVAVDNKNNAQDTQISALTSRVSSAETVLGGKASSSAIGALDSRVTAVEPKVSDLLGRVSAIEGGATGGGAAPLHSGLRGLVTNPTTGVAVDDHPQYLTAARGDARYYRQTDSDSRFAALSHADRHKVGGADVITPAMIGASPAGHVLGDHPSTGQIQPLVFIKTADSSPTNKPHASIATDVPTDSTPTLRSLRQGVVHPIDQDVADVVMGATTDNLLWQYDFTVRETCELIMSLTLWVFMNAPGSVPVGTTGEATFGLTCLDVDAGTTVFSTSAGWWPVNATTATYNFRGSQCPSMHVPLGGPYQRGRKYRMVGRGRKTGANADLVLFYVRGFLLEAAMVSG